MALRISTEQYREGPDTVDNTDPFTFLDDTTEYFPKVHPTTGALLSGLNRLPPACPCLPTKIGQDGTLTTTWWQRPNDGVIVPLNPVPVPEIR